MEICTTPSSSYIEVEKNNTKYSISYFRDGAYNYAARLKKLRPWFLPDEIVRYFQYTNARDAITKYNEIVKEFTQ